MNAEAASRAGSPGAQALRDSQERRGLPAELRRRIGNLRDQVEASLGRLGGAEELTEHPASPPPSHGR